MLDKTKCRPNGT